MAKQEDAKAAAEVQVEETGRPKGPDDPEGPDHEWFQRGTVEENKFDPYLFNPGHPANQSKARGWQRTFGLGPGDGPLLERLIRDQLVKAEIEETEPRTVREDISGRRRIARKWALTIREFEVPGRRPARVVTAWAQEPDEEYPHLVTAIVRP